MAHGTSIMIVAATWSIVQSPWLGNLRGALDSPFAEAALILAAIACGTIIGQERGSRHKPAGMRTITLICVGSTVFTFCGILMAGHSADPSRIASNIVTGIGFLGAGTIIRDRGTVVGLTTGATIWVSAAIGMLIGIGYAVSAVLLSVVIVAVLHVHSRVERRALQAEAEIESETDNPLP